MPRRSCSTWLRPLSIYRSTKTGAVFEPHPPRNRKRRPIACTMTRRYSMVVNSDIPMLDDAEEEAPDTNMWDDPPESQTTGIRYDETKNIVAASLNRLIEALTSVENYGTSPSFFINCPF